MSSSDERGNKAEKMAREWLQNEFNIPFSKRNLRVGWKSDGKPAMHNFDLVSEDGQIVAEVKSHQLTKSGNIPSGKISDTYGACLMLEKATARKKFLVLTDSKFHEIFTHYSNGKISKKIEIVLLANGIALEKPNNTQATPSSTKMNTSGKVDFAAFWSDLTSWLSIKKHIVNWTEHSGEISESFGAVYTGGNYVIAYPGSAGIQRIPKSDFKIMYENWDGYVTGLIPRSYFVKGSGSIARSRFSKYVISIIHQYLSGKRKT
jgi:hypothetical protein